MSALATSLALTTADYGWRKARRLPGHRSRTCSSRSAPRARRSCRSSRPRRSARSVRCRPTAWSSPWPPTRTRASGVAPPRRSAASCAGPTSPARRPPSSLSRRSAVPIGVRPTRPAHQPAARGRRDRGIRSSTTVPVSVVGGGQAGRREVLRRWPGATSIVPPSSVVTSVRTIDRPSPVAVSSAKPSGSPTPSSTTGTVERRAVVGQHARRPTRPARRPGRRGRRRSGAAR